MKCTGGNSGFKLQHYSGMLFCLPRHSTIQLCIMPAPTGTSALNPRCKCKRLSTASSAPD
uniref:Uncharacterized protein n=1 Tax=Arundo donax TaxID=35708 RepID=A0A0A9G0W1_ARUDO